MNVPRLVLLTWTAMTFPGIASASSYSFHRVVDSHGPFSDFFGAPAINAARSVAFPAYLDAGGHGIFAESGGVVTTIADTNGPTNAILTSPSINAAGVVAFAARLDSGGEGVFIGDGGPTTTIADNSGRQFDSFFGSVPAINSSGVVSFFAELDNDRNGIFTVSGGSTTTIADSSGPFNNLRSNPSINAEGTVAFFAILDDFTSGIFTGRGGVTKDVLYAGGLFSGVGPPLINDNGIIAFAGRPALGGEGFFMIDDGTITTIVDDGGPFRFFDVFSLNMTASGKVAFAATLDDETPGIFFDDPTGIFTGDDAVTDKVIQTGDMLFGSIVTELFFRRGLNDQGDVAFRYELANGTEGIAVASSIPEPASLALAIIAAVSGFAFVGRTTEQAPSRRSGMRIGKYHSICANRTWYYP